MRNSCDSSPEESNLRPHWCLCRFNRCHYSCSSHFLLLQVSFPSSFLRLRRNFLRRPNFLSLSFLRQLRVHRIILHENLFFSLLLNGISVIAFISIVMLDEFHTKSSIDTIIYQVTKTSSQSVKLPGYWKRKGCLL